VGFVFSRSGVVGRVLCDGGFYGVRLGWVWVFVFVVLSPR